ncbi:hypothetical protein PR202_ga27170 [Eleusine coracana subsp. coracana]|uniref:Uncharacterized protein n=1 Tax=Eleusine coracana subsp. coracana TaxID=191504 RepID=A0AAV5DG25_ELECO|nr:hypothetical protein PR202_ga27170 [Eleusine coracana subsp. coracana]
MAVGFRRRLMALSVPKASSLLLRRRTRHKKLSYSRTRSTSLPGRFHPVVAGLHESAAALVAWTDKQEVASTAWIDDGVARLGRVLAGLTDLLHHPQAHNNKAAPWAERLLDDLLLLADAHACFRDALLSLAHLLAEARAALRRRDAARLAAALRARRRSDRDLSRLASTLCCLAHRSSSSSFSSIGADSGEAALAEAVAAATSAAAAASAAIFSGLASASASSSAASRSMTSPTMAVSPAAKVAAVPVWWVADLLRWRRRTPLEECCDEEEDERQAAMERLRSLEDCVVAAEDGCEQVYRALVNARVSLLNVMTPCF